MVSEFTLSSCLPFTFLGVFVFKPKMYCMVPSIKVKESQIISYFSSYVSSLKILLTHWLCKVLGVLHHR